MKVRRMFARHSEKHRSVICRFTPRIITDFLSETIQARDNWRNISEVLREEKNQARILSAVKIIFYNKAKVNFCPNKSLKNL